MAKKILAITTCRVSTPEQEENNSLERQRTAVIQAANELGATIPEDGQWSGSVSSKAGTNTKRKDLKEMLEYCKKHPQVKYLIVHEVDRFMRSVDELFYFEVRFREEVGVKIYYASQAELNTDDHKAKLFKALEAFKGEGSNVERQMKSIAGQTAALKAGRWPFAPKPGYKRGREKGVPEIDEVRGPALKKILLDTVSKQLTPTQALKKLNHSAFTRGRAQYKMDKFRKIATDPFYAGVVEMDKQVKVRENGLHEPLITLEQHYELTRIFEAKGKNQSGPREGGNPKYPLNNIVSCDLCKDRRNGRVVGFDHGNGKPQYHKHWEKYRCRACKRYTSRQELHSQVEQCFKNHPISSEGLKRLTNALNIVWKQQEVQAAQDTRRIKQKIKILEETVKGQVKAAANPSNNSIKDDLMGLIAEDKAEIAKLEDELVELSRLAEADNERFLKFAFEFIESMGSNFLEIPPENRLRCKQIVFPAGFWWSAKGKVYTPEISPLITLATNKKDTEVPSNSLMVQDS